MTAEPVPDRHPAYAAALLDAGERFPSLLALEVEADGGRLPSAFATRFPARHRRLPARPEGLVEALREVGRSGGPVFLRGPVHLWAAEGLGPLVRDVALPRRNVKIIGDDGASGGVASRRASPTPDDLTVFRSVPAVTVVAPADGPSVRAAVGALAEREGTAYLRLPPGDAPALSELPFAIGRARELRAGTDLTLLGYGPILGRLLGVAQELAEVGVGARVLDLASVKPIDEAAILRAARDTGALLVAEPAPLLTGLGTLVAALTAENYPVPVRRLGLSDVAGDGEDRSAADDPGLAPERLRDEVWELLRLRGKVQ